MDKASTQSVVPMTLTHMAELICGLKTGSSWYSQQVEVWYDHIWCLLNHGHGHLAGMHVKIDQRQAKHLMPNGHTQLCEYRITHLSTTDG